MNEKEKKVEIEFGFIAIAGALGIFLSIFSNAVYDLLIGVYKLRILLVALGSGLLALLFVNFLDFTIKNRDFKEDKFWKLFFRFIRIR